MSGFPREIGPSVGYKPGAQAVGQTIGFEGPGVATGFTKVFRPSKDPFTQAVSIAPPAWTAKTYIAGEAVEASGNWYLCAAGGASTVAPSGTSPNVQLPDAVAWYYMGAARALNTIDAPTLSVSGSLPGGYPKIWHAATGDRTAFEPVDAFSVEQSAADNPASLFGGYSRPGTSAKFTGQRWGFVTDAPAFVIHAYFNAQLRVIVDDVPVTFGDIALPNPTGESYTTINFGGIRKVRRIEVHTGSQLRGVRTTNADFVYASKSLPTEASMLFIGDSYDAGTPYNPVRMGARLSHIVGDYLGVRRVFGMSRGSSSFTGAVSVDYVYGDRIRRTENADLIAQESPEIVVFSGTRNEAFSGKTAAEASIAAEKALIDTRELLPNAYIFLTGVVSADDQTTYTGVEAAYASAVQRIGDARIQFIPVLTGAPNNVAWFNPDNYFTYLNPAPDRHPDQMGLHYIAARIAAEIKARLT